MKKRKKEKGVAVARIAERAVANLAVARFLERTTATFYLTTGFVVTSLVLTMPSASIWCCIMFTFHRKLK